MFWNPFILTSVRVCSTPPWACFCDRTHLSFQDRISESRNHHRIYQSLFFYQCLHTLHSAAAKQEQNIYNNVSSHFNLQMHEELRGVDIIMGTPVKYKAIAGNCTAIKATFLKHIIFNTHQSLASFQKY